MCLVGKVFAVFHTKRCKYDGPITKIAFASAHNLRESSRADVRSRQCPTPEHPFRSITDPLSTSNPAETAGALLQRCR